jgi:hypothetical protein
MTLTPVIPMEAGTGFGAGTATTTMSTASEAKSQPVETGSPKANTKKANQVSEETEASKAPPPAGAKESGEVAGEATSLKLEQN